jgi:hypothetical protein
VVSRKHMKCGIMVSAMKSTRVFSSILPLALAGLLLAGGCKKNPQPNSETTATATQPATPAPPADQGTSASAAQPEASSSAAQPSSAPANSPAGAPPPTASAAAPAQPPAPPPPPPPPPPIVVPAGTHIAVTTQQDLGSKISQPGQTFVATMAAPIRIQGVTVIPTGAKVAGTVVDAKAQGKIKGSGELDLRLDTVYVRGNTIPLQTDVLEREVKGKGKRTAVAAGGGAGLGAIIGGLAGGGKGAAVGALVGGAGGTAAGAFTGNKQIVIPAESTLTFRLAHSITYQPPASADQGAPAQAPPQ